MWVGLVLSLNSVLWFVLPQTNTRCNYGLFVFLFILICLSVTNHEPRFACNAKPNYSLALGCSSRARRQAKNHTFLSRHQHTCLFTVKPWFGLPLHVNEAHVKYWNINFSIIAGILYRFSKMVLKTGEIMCFSTPLRNKMKMRFGHGTMYWSPKNASFLWYKDIFIHAFIVVLISIGLKTSIDTLYHCFNVVDNHAQKGCVLTIVIDILLRVL